jgi:hypothetical protein
MSASLIDLTGDRKSPIEKHANRKFGLKLPVRSQPEALKSFFNMTNNYIICMVLIVSLKILHGLT